MKSMRRVSRAPGLGADCSRVATCGGRGSAGNTFRFPAHHTHHPPPHPRVGAPFPLCPPYLLVVGPGQAEHKAAVHQGQQVAEEEGQAGIQALGQLRILRTQGPSAHALAPRASVPTQGPLPPRLPGPHHSPRHACLPAATPGLLVASSLRTAFSFLSQGSKSTTWMAEPGC